MQFSHFHSSAVVSKALWGTGTLHFGWYQVLQLLHCTVTTCCAAFCRYSETPRQLQVFQAVVVLFLFFVQKYWSHFVLQTFVQYLSEDFFLSSWHSSGLTWSHKSDAKAIAKSPQLFVDFCICTEGLLIRNYGVCGQSFCCVSLMIVMLRLS